MKSAIEARLRALGFEQDKGGFWLRGDDSQRTVIGEAGTLSDTGRGWLLIAELVAPEDLSGEPISRHDDLFTDHIEIARLRFSSADPLLDALEAGEPPKLTAVQQAVAEAIDRILANLDDETTEKVAPVLRRLGYLVEGC